MSGDTDLARLLASMSPVLIEGVFVFASVEPGRDLAGVDVVMQFREAEGLTLVLRREDAMAQAIAADYPCRMITLNVHSSLEAVGFLAVITRALAADGISVNAVSAFYHDHLFVPEARAADAMAVLERLAATGAA
ncbi:MAG: ribonuclease H family protein [Hirschia sp.]|nr:ribonuclease H family protein [Hirschia sp.]MBF19260.1 ribonuclease H family protein [Hirschia sp.]